MGPHLSPEFGHTVREIERDGLEIAARIECLLSSDTDVGMAKTIGVATLSLADCLGQMRPDLLSAHRRPLRDAGAGLGRAGVAHSRRAHRGRRDQRRRHRQRRAPRAHQDEPRAFHFDLRRARPSHRHGRGRMARASRRRAVHRSPAPRHATTPANNSKHICRSI